MEVHLSPWQTKVFQDKARFKVLRCGRRAGKTYLAITLLIAKAIEEPGDYWFVGPYYRQAKEIAWKILLKMLPEGAVRQKNESDLSVVLINGASIKLKGADNPDSLKGVGLSGCVLDEFAFMKPAVWDEIIRPMLFDTNGWCLFISTPYGYNHFYDMWESILEKPDWSRYHFTSYDNPHITEAEIDEAKASMDPLRFSQEILAEFTKKSGAVWGNFSRDVHVVPRREWNEGAYHIAHIDFGYAIGHPTSFAIHEINGYGDIHTGDGFMSEGLNIHKIDELMRMMTKGTHLRTVYYDLARPDLADELQRLGWPMAPANKDVELGIAKVDEYMMINPITKQPRWTISDHLKDEIRQVEEYEWMEVRGDDGKYKQMPKKEQDDFCDGLRYALYTHTLPDKKQDEQQAYIYTQLVNQEFD